MSFSKIPFCVFFMLILTVTRPSWADFYLKPNIYYNQNKSQSPSLGGISNEDTRTSQILDLSAYYAFGGSWLVGATTGMETITSTYFNTTYTKRYMGPSVGWISSSDSGPFFIASYLNSCTMTGNQNTSYKKATCYEVDLGYRIKFKSFGIGPQLSYRYFEFKQYETGTFVYDLTFSDLDADLRPMISLFFSF